MRTNKVIPTMLLVLTTAMTASIGMSVAWYANGAYLRVSNIRVSLMSDPTLGIGLKPSSNSDDYFYGTFPYDELPKMMSGYSDGEDYSDVENGFVPVSSMFSDDWIGKKDSNGNNLDPVFCSNYKRASIYDESTFKKTNPAVSGFYSVPLYFYCDRDMYMTIDSSGTAFAPDIVKNKIVASELYKNDQSSTIDEYEADLNNIVNSLRISLYDCSSAKYWIIDPTKGDTITYYAGVLDLDADKVYDYYGDPETGTHKEIFFGEYDDSFDVVYKTVNDYSEPDTYDVFRAKHLDSVNEVDFDYYVENNKVKAEDSYLPSELDGKDMIALTNHVPQRVVMSIYIEGWDLDNTAVSALGSFFSSIKFKLTRPNFSN